MVRSCYPLFASAIVLIVMCSTASAQTVAWYRFNDGVPGQAVTTAIDSGPNHLDGVSAGPNALYYGSASGLPNAGNGVLNALNDSDFINVADNQSMHLQGDLTIESYFYFPANYHITGDGLHDYLFAKQNNTGFGEYLSAWGIYVTRAGDQFVLGGTIGFGGNAGVFLNPSNGVLVTNQWHHAAMVLDRDVVGLQDALTLYLDGVQVGQSTGDYADLFYGSAPLEIGAGNFGDDPNGVGLYRRNFGGLIDEVRITSSALTPGQFLNGGNVSAPEPGTLALFALPTIIGGTSIIRRKKGRLL